MSNREDWAKRLAAHPRWVWLEGMRFLHAKTHPDMIHRVTEGGLDGYPESWKKSAFPALFDWGTRGILLGIAWEGLGPLTIGLAGGTNPGQISVAGTTVGRCLGACADTLEEALADIILQWWERHEDHGDTE